MTRRGFFKLLGAASVGAAVSPWAWLTKWFTKAPAIESAINLQVVTAPMIADDLFRSTPLSYVWIQLTGESQDGGVVGKVIGQQRSAAVRSLEEPLWMEAPKG